MIRQKWAQSEKIININQKNQLLIMPRSMPEKCRLCAKLTAVQAKLSHGPKTEGDECWDSTVCPSRRSHARHRDRRNQARKLKRWQELGGTVVALDEKETDSVVEQQAIDANNSKQIHFQTQLPNVTKTAVLQVYRQAVDAPIHAVGGEIWRLTEKEASIAPVHCMKMTPRQVEIYLERLLKKLQEVYGIRKFATLEELNPRCCPLNGCLERL